MFGRGFHAKGSAKDSEIYNNNLQQGIKIGIGCEYLSLFYVYHHYAKYITWGENVNQLRTYAT